MKYYIIAGEASGDLHASNLLRELKVLDPEADFRCWGGDLVEKQGATLVKHYRDLAFMGFAEVVSHLPTILGNFRFCEKDLLAYQPDVLILVDYPGFNLRMAKFAKQNGIRVFYYISPQLWAWHSSRVNDIKKWELELESDQAKQLPKYHELIQQQVDRASSTVKKLDADDNNLFKEKTGK